MMDLKKIPNLLLVIALFAGSLLITRPTLAQQESQPSDENNFNLPASSWVTKGGMYSFLYNLQYALRDAVTWNPHVNNKLSLMMANNSLAVAEKNLAESQSDPLALKEFEKSINRYQREIKEIGERAETFNKKAENNPEQTAKFLNLNKFTEELLLQQKVLAQLINTAPAEQKSVIENIKENSLNNLAQVLAKIDEPAKIGERLSWAMNKQNNQEVATKVNNLEIFQLLQEKLPPETQKIISRTQIKTLTEIKESAQNLKTAAEREQLKSTIENSKINGNLQSQLINYLPEANSVLENENSFEPNNKENQSVKTIFPTVKGKIINKVKNIPAVSKPVKKTPIIASPKKTEATPETPKEAAPLNRPVDTTQSPTEVEPPINNVNPQSTSPASETQPTSNATGAQETETSPNNETATNNQPETPKTIIIHSRGGGSAPTPPANQPTRTETAPAKSQNSGVSAPATENNK